MKKNTTGCRFDIRHKLLINSGVIIPSDAKEQVMKIINTMVDTGKNILECCKILEISHPSLRRWINNPDEYKTSYLYMVAKEKKLLKPDSGRFVKKEIK